MRKSLLAILLCLSAPMSMAAETLKPVTFMTLWVPQAQFAGYYMAKEKGIYAKHGLDVTIASAGPDRPVGEQLRTGKVDFSLMWLSQALELEEQGADAVNFGQVTRKSGLMLVARKSTGIKGPGDLEGRRVGLWQGFEAQPRAFFTKYGVHVSEVPQAMSPSVFLRGGLDVISAMIYDEYHLLLSAGVNPDELTVFAMSDYGFSFPEDGLYALSATYKKDSSAACEFAKASFEGWRYALTHEDETLDVLIRLRKMALLPAQRAHQRWMLRRMGELIGPGRAGAGILDRRDFDDAVSAMREAGQIKKSPAFEEFFRSCGAYD